MYPACPQKSVRPEDFLRGLCCCPGRQIFVPPYPARLSDAYCGKEQQVAGRTFWSGTQRQYTTIASLKRELQWPPLVNVLEVEGIWCIASVCSILSWDCLYCQGLAYLSCSQMTAWACCPVHKFEVIDP